MTLIVETGSASASSEAYASLSYADNHHSDLGNTTWAALSRVEKEQALRRAAQFMCQCYRLRWKGSRVNSTQALDWPRYDVEMPDLGVYNIIEPTVVPDLVLRANAELALIASTSVLNPTLKQAVLSKQIGPIKLVYDTASHQGSKYVAVNDLLAPLLSAANGVSIKLRRV